MLKISWTDKVTNEEVLVRANDTGSVLKTIWRRKRRWLGHVRRHENVLHGIIEGKMLGKATRDWRRMQLLHDDGKKKQVLQEEAYPAVWLPVNGLQNSAIPGAIPQIGENLSEIRPNSHAKFYADR